MDPRERSLRGPDGERMSAAACPDLWRDGIRTPRQWRPTVPRSRGRVERTLPKALHAERDESRPSRAALLRRGQRGRLSAAPVAGAPLLQCRAPRRVELVAGLARRHRLTKEHAKRADDLIEIGGLQA